MAKCARCGSEITAGGCPVCNAAPAAKKEGSRVLAVLLWVFGGLVLFCVIGMVAAYFGTRGTVEKARAKRAMAEARAAATAIQSYGTDFAGYPIQEELGPVSGISKFLCPDYIKTLPPYEGAKGEYLYMSRGKLEPNLGLAEPLQVAEHFLVIWPGTDDKLDPETEALLKPIFYSDFSQPIDIKRDAVLKIGLGTMNVAVEGAMGSPILHCVSDPPHGGRHGQPGGLEDLADA